MTLSVELYQACCASVSKIATFASLDPMFGIPTGSPTSYLGQQHFSLENLRLYYRQSLQKGAYMMELAFQEAEGIEENVFTPFMESIDEDQEEVRKKIVHVCKKLCVPETVDELSAELDDNAIADALEKMRTSSDIFQAPDAMSCFLNKIAGYDPEDNAFILLIGEGLLFQAIDYQYRSLVLSDNRGKSMGGFTSYMKMKLRINLIKKQIENKRKENKRHEEAGDSEQVKRLTEEISVYEQAAPKIADYIDAQGKVLERLHSQITRLYEQVGHAVLEKVSKMTLTSIKEKTEAEGGNVVEIVEEVNKLIKQPMEFVGGDRIEFGHNLLGPILDAQKPKLEKAKSLFESIPNTDPQKPILANRLGVILNAMGIPDKAAEYFRRALVLLPSSQRDQRGPIESNLFHTLLNKGSFEAALRYMMESLEAGSEECNLFDIERYQPKKILGVGGMGVTFLCEDVYEESQVVIKTLWRYATGSLKDTFSEAFTAKKINDPHIVRVFNIGRHRANRPFIVMEYCEGYDLARYIQEVKNNQPLEVSEALFIISEVARGLDAFHCQSPPIIHCDIKPNNILYRPDSGEIKIIDFGIACMMPEAEEISRTVSRTSSGGLIAKNMAGTWGYMSPEQQRGESSLDPRIDIFSLGKTLMFLLTGKTPPPENIFALAEQPRNIVGELVGYCLMPHAQERYTARQVLEKIEEIQKNLKEQEQAPVAVEPMEGAAMMATPVSESSEMDFGDQVEMMASPAEEDEINASFAAPAPPPIVENFDEPVAEAVSADGALPPLFDSFEAPGEEPAQAVMDLSDPGAGVDLSDGGMDLSDPGAGMDLSDPGAGMDLSDPGAGMDLSDPGAGMDLSDPGAGMDLSDPGAGMDLSDPDDELPPPPDEDPLPAAPGGVTYDLPDDDLDSIDYNLDEPKPGGSIYVGKETGANGETKTMRAPVLANKVALPPGYSWEGDIVICEKDGATMVFVPDGAFVMGYEGEDKIMAESPEHEVILEGYLIDECLVTWYQYSLFCEETERKLPPKPAWEMDESQPVVNLSWEDANAYAKWAHKSLPSEAQWEKAARGGMFFDGDSAMMQKNLGPRRLYPWGNEAPGHSGQWHANCVGEPQYGERSTSPVGNYTDGASAYGCLDMAGNVWEWCEDWFSETYYSSCPASNPKGPRTGPGRVVRGGAWNSDHCYLRTSFRSYLLPDEWWNIVGFRTALTIMSKH